MLRLARRQFFSQEAVWNKTIFNHLFILIAFQVQLNMPGIAADNVFDEVVENPFFQTGGQHGNDGCKDTAAIVMAVLLLLRQMFFQAS